MDAVFERLHQELAAMTPQSPHTPSDSFYGAIPQEAPEAVRENLSSLMFRLPVGSSVEMGGTLWVVVGHTLEGGGATLIEPAGDTGSEIIEPDYDAILLAARKRRERQNIIIDADADDARTWDARLAEHDRAQLLDAALGVPLTFNRRVGWKPEGGE